MVLHSRGCGRVARRRFTRWASRSSLWLPGGPFFHALFPGFPAGVAPGTPVFFIRSRPLFIRLLVLAPRGMQEFFISRHLCIAWSVGVTVINDVMSLTRYTRAGSRESRYDRKRQRPDD